MPGTDIFLSYARTDRPAARLFAEAFAEEGFNVWWDASLHSGETFDEVIEQKLRDAGAVVVLWSPRSVASRWVRAEATLADRRKKLAPAIIEECDRPIIFELTHAADLCDWKGDRTDIHWRTFVDDLHRLIDAREDQQGHAARPAATPAPAPVAVPAPAARPPRPGNDEDVFIDEARRQAATPRDAQAVPLSDEVHCLEIEDGDVPDQLIVVDSTGVKIGRTAPADIVLPHRSISREHCIVGLANDELLVSDLNSTNGTYIDGARIHRATVLPVGSVLRLGQISLRHAVRTPSEAEPRSGLRTVIRPGALQAGRIAAAS